MNDRSAQLLRAALEFGDLHDLDGVLQAIIEAAKELVPARFAALGVLGGDGYFERFVHSGMDDDAEVVIGHHPRAEGVLELSLREQRPLRLHDVSTHPAHRGFPDGHPSLGSFISAPVLVDGEVYGNLYLGDREGGGGFSDTDEQLLVGLAATAGLAIHHAHQVTESRRRQDELLARGDLAAAVLLGEPASQVLADAAERARGLTGSVAVVLLAARGGALVVEAVAGVDPELVGLRIPLHDEEAVRLSGVLEDEDLHNALLPLLQRMGDGSVHAAAAEFGGERHGAVLLARPDRQHGLSEEHDRVLAAVANVAAIVLRHDRNTRKLQRIAVLDDRARIARDLHDTVVQRLFAIGLDAQGLSSRLAEEHTEAAAEIGNITEALDDVIADIRTAIFMLRHDPARSGRSFRQQVVNLLSEFREALGFEPALTVEGPIDTVCTGPMCEAVLTAVREMLANAARHAEAAHVWVKVIADGRELVTEVRDDGKGFDPTSGPRSGLENLSRRAEELGGSFELRSEPGAGSVLRWTVPTR